MSDPAPAIPSWEQLRGYLHVLARLQIGWRLRGLIDPSSVVQQTLYEAYRDRATFRGEGATAFAAWLRGILFHKILDAARRVGREHAVAIEASSRRLAELLSAADSSPSEQALRQEKLTRLGNALESLPEDQRSAVELKHLHGWRVRAIATEMGRSETAVAGLLRRGLQTLRDLLRE